jgi:hypothetical protein
MLDPPDVFVVRHEFVLRLFLLSTLEPDEARAVLRPVVEGSARELATLRESIDKADVTTPPGAIPAFGRLVAEYGLRSFQTMHDWALWALEQIDQAEPTAGRTHG